MKRVAINVIFCFASFTLGVAATSLLNWNTRHTDQPKAEIAVQPPAETIDEPEATKPEVVFGGGRLRITANEVILKNERLRYKVDVTYPQILGSVDRHIRKLNEHLEQLATQQYDWPLNPSKADLRYYRERWPEVFNSVDVNYEIRSATDSFLSIYFNCFSYGIGAAHSVQYSFVVNYDLSLQREVKLSDIFKPRSKYLEFISHYCRNELGKPPKLLFGGALAPNPENFQSWNVTRDGIRFNFDECSIFGCADGEKEVEIPFSALKDMMRPQALTSLITQRD